MNSKGENAIEYMFRKRREQNSLKFDQLKAFNFLRRIVRDSIQNSFNDVWNSRLPLDIIDEVDYLKYII